MFSVIKIELSGTMCVMGFPCSSVGKESACNAEDPGLIPGLRRSPLEKEMADNCSILAWEMPQTEEPGSLQSMQSQSRTRLRDSAQHSMCVIEKFRSFCKNFDTLALVSACASVCVCAYVHIQQMILYTTHIHVSKYQH